MSAHKILQNIVNTILPWLSQHVSVSPLTKLKSSFIWKKETQNLISLHPFKISTDPPFPMVRFNSNHSWISHLEELTAKGLRTLNVIKYLAHLSTGCNRKVLLMLYKSLVRSILDYGAPVYAGLVPKSQLTILYLIENLDIRI